MNLKAIRYGSVKHNQVLLKFDYMFESKKIYNSANITKTFTAR